MGQRLQSPVARAGDRLTAPAVVDQGIDGFLKHTLLVLNDDGRRAQIQQLLQTVVTGDDSSVEVIQVTGGEAAAVQLHHRTQIRRYDRQLGKDHPLGTLTGFPEGVDGVQSLDQLLANADIRCKLHSQPLLLCCS